MTSDPKARRDAGLSALADWQRKNPTTTKKPVPDAVKFKRRWKPKATSLRRPDGRP